MLKQTLVFAVFRYIHLVAAIVGIGGLFLLKYVVSPAIAGEDEAVRNRFNSRARLRLAWMIPGALFFLFASGAVNLYRAMTVPPKPDAIYNILFGIKFLLVLPLFTIACFLVASGPPNIFQRNRERWLAFVTHLGLTIVALSVALRFLSGK